ncbi:hypothetical protein ACLB2K_065189 [Fragaria x ananassa]
MCARDVHGGRRSGHDMQPDPGWDGTVPWLPHQWWHPHYGLLYGCTNLRNMVNSATSTVDRQNACKCLKAAAAKFQTINPDNAAKLPYNCNVNIPYKISINTNCARYPYS